MANRKLFRARSRLVGSFTGSVPGNALVFADGISLAW